MVAVTEPTDRPARPGLPDAIGGRRRRTGLLGLEGLVDYRYEVALGEDTLSADELHRLAELKVPLVRVRGQWVELRSDEIEAALRSLESERERLARPPSLSAFGRGSGSSPPRRACPSCPSSADGWLGELLAADGRPEPLPTPTAFLGSLRPYQERGLGWLAFMDRCGLGACLADDMGLGKTVQLLALLLAEREASRKGRPRPTLLICPMSVVGNWQREAERFAPTLRVHVHHGGERLGGRTFAPGRQVVRPGHHDVRPGRPRRRTSRARRAGAGSSSTRRRTSRTARPGRAGPSGRCGAPSRIALTGTPVENRLAELWSIMDFLNPGLLGSARSFRERFAVPIERYGDDEAADRAQAHRRTVRAAAPQDRPLDHHRPAGQDRDEGRLQPHPRAGRRSTRRSWTTCSTRIEPREGIERRGLVLATMMKLKQVCNHPAHLLADGSRLDGRSGKLARLEEILEEVLAEGDRALVFTQFAEMGHLLRDHLQRRLGAEVLFLHGGAAQRARDEMVARFQSTDGPPVFVLSLKAGGTGLNLTAANHVIHFDRWWNPAVEDQATDRAFRIGQRRNVQVRKLVCVGTLEERIDRMIEEKRELAERIVGTRRSLAHRALHRPAARAGRAVDRRGGGGVAADAGSTALQAETVRPGDDARPPVRSDALVSAAIAAAARGWHPRPQPARRDRRDVVVAAVHRAARVVRRGLAPEARPQLRASGSGARARGRARRGHRPSPGLAVGAVPGPDPRPSPCRRRTGRASRRRWREGCLPRQAPRGRDAARHRGGLRRDASDAVPGHRAATSPATAPARTGRTRASTSRPPTTCSPKRFDADPFLIFAWRGRDREELLERLRARPGEVTDGTRGSDLWEVPDVGMPPLAETVDRFWEADPGIDQPSVRPRAIAATDGILRGLDPELTQVSGRPLTILLAPAYPAITSAAERIALRQRVDSDQDRRRP